MAAVVWASAVAAGAESDSLPAVIRRIRLEGDGEMAAALPAWDDWRREWEGKPLAAPDLDAAARALADRLREAGYLFAAVRVRPPDPPSGTAVFDVDLGRIGRLTLTNPDGTPFRGRWFDEAQLRYRLSGLDAGRPFEEGFVYQTLLSFNAHPDLTADPVLTVRREATEGGSRRVVDMACAITERVPLHGALTVDNAGLEPSGEWRASLVLQHLNLTRRDDILTLYAGPFSAGDGAAASGAASYYRPFCAGRGGHTLWYAGYADVEARDIAEIFRIRGAGWFAGVQAGWRLQANPSGEWVAIGGAGFRRQEEQFSVETAAGGTIESETKTLDAIPLTLALQRTPFQPDGLGGRTFWEFELAAGFLPGDEADIHAFRPGLDQGYGAARGRVRRLQALGRPETAAGRRWMAAVRLEGQIGTGSLPAAEQMALGGMDSIRGFPERAVMGDWGGWGSLEVRTPVWDIGGGMGLQGVGFADAGHAGWESMADTTESLTLAGAGGGLRFSWLGHIQAQLDYGVPLSGRAELEEQGLTVESAGRLHVRVMAQF